MNLINHVLCRRTDLLVLFWLFGGGVLFFSVLIPLTDNGLIQIGIAIMYYVVAIQFNNWREKYCEKCKESKL